MSDIKTLALILLILRLVAVSYLGLVIKRQVKLLRDTSTPYTNVRLVLVTLVGITFISNFVPILIDTATLLNEVTRMQPYPLGVAYAFSNAITAVVSAVGWWVLYRIIEKEQVVLKKGRK